MNSEQRTGPWWQPSGINISRRRALVGVSGLMLAAMRTGPTSAQVPGRDCVLTPEAGEGPFYLDPELVRADITAAQPGAPLQMALEVVRAGDCATLANARVDVWHADGAGTLLRLRETVGRRWRVDEIRRGPAVSPRHTVHRPGRPRPVPHDLPELVRRTDAARALQGVPGRQRGGRKPG